MDIQTLSSASQSHVDYVSPVAPAPRRVVGFVIGLENYQACAGQMSIVDYAHNDANAFADAVRSLYRGAEIELEILLDSAATKTRLEYYLQETIRGLNKDDLFVFYFAGHGFHNAQGNRITAWDSSAYNIETTLLLRDVLLDPLRNSACTRALLFVDACAAALQSSSSRDVLSNLNPEELRNFLGHARYCATFLSCSPGEKSYPSEELQHGIWTHFLLKALRGEAPDALGPGQFLTDVGLRDHLKRVVPEYIKSTKRSSIKQTPSAILDATNTVGLLEVLNSSVEADAAAAAQNVQSSTDDGADIPSREIQPKLAGTLTPLSTLLAVVNSGIAEEHPPCIATLTLATDEPSLLSDSVEDIKRQLRQDLLFDVCREPGRTLLDFFENPGAQSRVLEWLATTSFSAHLYFLPNPSVEECARWPESTRLLAFVVMPLIHRISDKSTSVETVISNIDRVEEFVVKALEEIEIKFHRVVKHPSVGDKRRNPQKAIFELADLVLHCCVLYLLNPTDNKGRAIFAHVRTRLKYATNVATQERHTRDKNPLP